VLPLTVKLEYCFKAFPQIAVRSNQDATGHYSSKTVIEEKAEVLPEGNKKTSRITGI